jgi:pimeloyl-ACP methyl ester carboxylesterase
MLARSLGLATFVLLMAGCATPGFEPHAEQSPQAAHVEAFEILVDGQPATGFVGVPATEPTTLLVIAHPWMGTAEGYRPDLQAFAERGLLAVAMDFRGDVRDFKVHAGVADTIAATQALQAAHPSIDRTLLYGYSLGGEVALLAAAEAPAGTFDYVFAGAGVADLQFLWGFFPPGRLAIEQEAGGTPAQVPDAYRERSPVDRTAELVGKGVARYVVLQGAGDTVVDLGQGERLYAAMRDAGLPVSYYVVTVDQGPWVCTPVAALCAGQVPEGAANHEAGALRLMTPFLEHRFRRMPDPAPGASRGNYNGETGVYSPADVG